MRIYLILVYNFLGFPLWPLSTLRHLEFIKIFENVQTKCQDNNEVVGNNNEVVGDNNEVVGNNNEFLGETNDNLYPLISPKQCACDK